MLNSNKTFTPNDILSFSETCKLLNICRTTLWHKISTKREPGKIYGKKVGGLWRIQRKDIYKYLNGKYKKDSKDKIVNDILSFSEVCKLLKISQPALDRILSNKRHRGKIYGRKYGRAWKIQRKNIYRFLNKEGNCNGR